MSNNRCSILNLSKDGAGTVEWDGVALHKSSGVPLAGRIRDGVAAHGTTGDPLSGTIKCKGPSEKHIILIFKSSWASGLTSFQSVPECLH